MKERRKLSEDWNEKQHGQNEKSGVSIAFGVMAGIAAFVAIYTGTVYSTESAVQQIYVVAAQIKYVLWAILFMTGALYWKN